MGKALSFNQINLTFCPECDQRAHYEAYGSAQRYHPAGPTDPPCAQLLLLGHHYWEQHGAALQQEAGMFLLSTSFSVV